MFGDNELAKAMSYRTNELPDVAGRLVSTPSTVVVDESAVPEGGMSKFYECILDLY